MKYFYLIFIPIGIILIIGGVFLYLMSGISLYAAMIEKDSKFLLISLLGILILIVTGIRSARMDKQNKENKNRISSIQN